MNRVVGLETEFGCLVSWRGGAGECRCVAGASEESAFPKGQVGAIDLHYRDYEEPPGNGGFLLNGGRIYIDMGHLEYSSPECRTVRDTVAYDVAGEMLLQSRSRLWGSQKRSPFSKTTSITTRARPSAATRTI
jgi:proteasome accessory factor A